MTQVNAHSVVHNNDSSDLGRLAIPRVFLVAALRCARLRVQLLCTEIDEIGVALSHEMITPEVAIEWLNDIDALRFVTVPTEGTQ